MLKREELSDPNSCWNTSGDDDVVFVLKGKDIATPATIMKWIEERVVLGKNKYGDQQLNSAEATAKSLEAEHIEQGLVERLPAPKSEEDLKKYTAAHSRIFGAHRVDGYEVPRWPEFIALAKRLGIYLSLPWKGLTLRMYKGEMVTITQEYAADNIDQKDATTPFDRRLRAVNTTTIHNETLATFKPDSRSVPAKTAAVEVSDQQTKSE